MENKPSPLELAIDALSSGEDSLHHLNMLGDLIKAELVEEGFILTSVETSMEIFHSVLIDALAEGLSPADAVFLAKESIIEGIATVEADQQDLLQEDALLRALASGEQIEHSLLAAMDGNTSSQVIFQQAMQKSILEGAPIATALTNSALVAEEDALLSAQGDNFLKALAGSDGLAEAFKELEDAITSGVPEEHREVALKAFTETLKEMLAQGKSLEDAKQLAGAEVRSAVELAETLQSEMSSQDAFLTALASGNGVDQAIGDMASPAPNVSPQAFQNALAAALAEGQSANESFDNAAADASAVSLAEASIAIEVPAGNDLLAALATGTNIQDIIESLSQNGSDAQFFQNALNEALASGENPANAINLATVLTQDFVEATSGAENSLLVALATGAGDTDIGNMAESFQAALMDAIAQGQDLKTAMSEAESTAQEIAGVSIPVDTPVSLVEPVAVATVPVSVAENTEAPSAPPSVVEVPAIVPDAAPMPSVVAAAPVPLEMVQTTLPATLFGFELDAPSDDDSDAPNDDGEATDEVEVDPEFEIPPRSAASDDNDDDNPVVVPPTPQPVVIPIQVEFALTASPLSISEEAAESTIFSLAMSGDALTGTNEATINIDPSGTATNVTDYSSFYAAIDAAIAGESGGVSRSGSTLTFTSAFDGSLDFTVSAIDDGNTEGTETIIGTLSDAAVTGGSADITTASASVDITETDVTVSTPHIVNPMYNYSPSATSVSQILGSTGGIAVTYVDDTYGEWQYSADGSTWTAFTGLSDTSATLLDGSEYIRFVPNVLFDEDGDPTFDGQATFTFSVWDLSTNSSQDTGVDITSLSSVTSDDKVASVSVVSQNPTSPSSSYNYDFDLASDHPSEWLAIYLTAGETYTFTVDNTGTYDADISGVYNISGYLLSGTTDETATGDASSASYLATETGYHYLEITSDSDLDALIAAGDPTEFSYDFTYDQVVDPLIIDLDGNGIAFTTVDTEFAMTPDGTAQAEGWVNSDDGFLILDKNGNGQVDDISEMFSEYFSEGTSSGMAALSAFDENADQVLNSSDAIFNQLSIWQDLNSDGVTDQGELRSLSDWGITEISLVSNAINEVDDDNIILSESQVTFENGQQTSMIEVGLVVDGEVLGADAYSQMTAPTDAENASISEGDVDYEFTEPITEITSPIEQEISPNGEIV